MISNEWRGVAGVAGQGRAHIGAAVLCGAAAPTQSVATSSLYSRLSSSLALVRSFSLSLSPPESFRRQEARRLSLHS